PHPGEAPHRELSTVSERVENGGVRGFRLAFRAAAALAVALGAFGLTAGALAAEAPAVLVGHIDGVINPITARSVDRVVSGGGRISNRAGVRGRSGGWAEEAVRESVSVRVGEALRLNGVELGANNVADLVAKIGGRMVKTASGDIRLATAGAALDEDGLNPIESLLHKVVDPQIAVLLFTLGTYGLIFELSNPGLIFPGIIGVIAIVMALFAFGTLDANAAGVALMVFAIVLFVLEIKVPAHGLLTAGGTASLIIGTIVVFPPGRPTFPGLRA